MSATKLSAVDRQRLGKELEKIEQLLEDNLAMLRVLLSTKQCPDCLKFFAQPAGEACPNERLHRSRP